MISIVLHWPQGYSERREVVELLHLGVSRAGRAYQGPWPAVLVFGAGLVLGLMVGARFGASPMAAVAGQQAREVGGDVLERLLVRRPDDGNSVALDEWGGQLAGAARRG
jgi:hypothetical protein